MDDNAVPTVSIDTLGQTLPAELSVLDVREDHEWEAGHIEGALHIPLGDLADRRGEIDPAARTVVVCHLGGRSARATAYLVHNGFDAVNLDGGMEAWEEAGLPVI